jgi:hypothetical protein
MPMAVQAKSAQALARGFDRLSPNGRNVLGEVTVTCSEMRLGLQRPPY